MRVYNSRLGFMKAFREGGKELVSGVVYFRKGIERVGDVVILYLVEMWLLKGV